MIRSVNELVACEKSALISYMAIENTNLLGRTRYPIDLLVGGNKSCVKCLAYCLNRSRPTFTWSSNRIPYCLDLFALGIYCNTSNYVDDECLRNQKVQDPTSIFGCTTGRLVSTSHFCISPSHERAFLESGLGSISVTCKSRNNKQINEIRPHIEQRGPNPH
jgi:hypothetical protein